MDSGLTQVARTDSAGMINFSNLYNERFELRTSLSGYSPNYQLVDLTTKLQLSWDIRLSHAGSHGGYDIGGNEYGLPSITDKLPAYVLKGGTWTQNEAGQWFYANGRTFTDEWAAIWNPQLDTDKGQPPFYWYHFGRDSAMTVGWLTDEDGGTYFLHNVSDGALGYLYTGWHWIDDDGDGISQCYYFETNSNGSRGRLYKSAVTPDGYTVDGNGQWIQDGRAAAKIIDR